MPETNFCWDPLSDNILQEWDETGAVTAEYTTEPGLYGNVISQNRGGVENQFHFDAQGSTLAITDENQDVTDTFSYSAFGEGREHTGLTEVAFQYNGRNGYYNDPLVALQFVRRRQYDPRSARWLSIEPIAQARLQYYLYARNSPLIIGDPSGQDPVLNTVEDEVSLGCAVECDEGEAPVDASVTLIARIVDVELKVNVKRLIGSGDKVTFDRKTPLDGVDRSNHLIAIVDREAWNVKCCVEKKTLKARVISAEKSKDLAQVQVERAVPPNFRLNRENMKAFADYALGPPKSWWYACPNALDVRCPCLTAVGPKAFGPRAIEKDAQVPGYKVE